MSVTILPTFKGYTVDLRLKEFRRAIPDVTLDFIPFNSPEGKKLFTGLKGLWCINRKAGANHLSGSEGYATK